MLWSFLVNCESHVHDLDLNIKIVIEPSPCWDFSNTVKEVNDVSEI